MCMPDFIIIRLQISCKRFISQKFREQRVMQTFKQLDQNSPKIIIDNEDDSYNIFIKLLMRSGLLEQGKSYHQMRCKKAPPKMTFGNRFKKVQTEFTLYEGSYDVTWNGESFVLQIQKGQAKLVTQCRSIEYLKRICIQGQSYEKVKEFVSHVFEIGNQQKNEEHITIYENNQGFWNVSKQKRPRRLQSVIFKQQFIQSVLDDIQDFILSQEWYTQMGIPYKRSYLLYGPPGTGKSSFAQAIAAEIKHSICFVNCSDRINDFNFNRLLNSAPKKSIILIEDVDAIFTQRKNAEKMNSLTFSGFLNAIDGVRSQQGRIIIMTTNFKQKLDPALLRPGRTDQMYEINYADHYQIEKMCLRFYKNQIIAKQFAKKIPEHKFSMSMIQGFLLKYRKFPQKIVQNTDQLLNSDQNVKMQLFLTEINCIQCLNDFKLEEVYTLAQAKNLCKFDLQRILYKLPELKRGRLIQTVRLDRNKYIKSEDALFKFIEQIVHDEQKQRNLKKFVRQQNVKTVFLVRDEMKRLESQQRPKDQTAIQQ